jgi:RNA polymerase II subunit A-like phosphatase
MLKEKKLALILDLDNTILHTTVADEAQLPPFKDVPDFFSFTLDDGSNYFVKLRYSSFISLFMLMSNFTINNMKILSPYLATFIKNMEKLFEIYIYTMGSISYANEITKIITTACGLSPNFFGDRIVTRDHTRSMNHAFTFFFFLSLSLSLSTKY